MYVLSNGHTTSDDLGDQNRESNASEVASTIRGKKEI